MNAPCILLILNKIPGTLKNVIVFGYPPMTYSPLLAKQYFPRQRQPALTDTRGCQKRSTVLSEPKFGPSNQKFLDPPLLPHCNFKNNGHGTPGRFGFAFTVIEVTEI